MTRPEQNYRPRRPVRHVLFSAVAAVALLFSSCTIKRATGPFQNPGLLESELTRGVSTKADARRLLGEPTGTGSALLPGRAEWHEIWCYESSEPISKSEGLPNRGQISLKLRQQVLLIAFHKEFFDGYMWYTNKISGRK